MKYHSEARSGTGVSKAIIDHESVEALGVSTTALADAAVYETEINDNAGLLIVKDETTTDTAVFLIVDTAGTVAPQLLGTQANFTITKDNAGTINVYVETGVIKVQNNSGGAIDLKVKSFL